VKWENNSRELFRLMCLLGVIRTFIHCRGLCRTKTSAHIMPYIGRHLSYVDPFCVLSESIADESIRHALGTTFLPVCSDATFLRDGGRRRCVCIEGGGGWECVLLLFQLLFLLLCVDLDPLLNIFL